MPEFGMWRRYPAGTFKDPQQVDECRQQAIQDARDQGFSADQVIFRPNAALSMDGYVRGDVVGWYAKR